MVLLELVGVTKDYPLGKTTVRALRGLDLVVQKGEVLAIMGASGSGKSTLLHILGCLDTPTAGKAVIDGAEFQSLSERQLTQFRGRKIGFVFQTFNLIQTVSAQVNVEIPMIFQGVHKEERARRARDLKVILDLLSRLSREDGKTVVIVTHDPEAAAIADRIVTLRDGRVIREEENV